jgi:hypothetical protein
VCRLGTSYDNCMKMGDILRGVRKPSHARSYYTQAALLQTGDLAFCAVRTAIPISANAISCCSSFSKVFHLQSCGEWFPINVNIIIISRDAHF